LEIGGQKFRDDGSKLADDGPELEIGVGELSEEGLELEIEDKKGRHHKSLPTKNGLKVLRPYFLNKMEV